MVLKRGDSGDAVRLLQIDLKMLGFTITHIDGQFGPELERAVKAFQASQKLPADGQAGTITISNLGQRASVVRAAQSADTQVITPAPAPVIIAQPVPKTPAAAINHGTTAKPDYDYLWETCTINNNKLSTVKSVCAQILMRKSDYKAVEAKLGVPWKLVSGLHYREASLNFNTQLSNGQSLKIKTTIVPKGRGPFKTWAEGADDALTMNGFNKKNFSTVPLWLAAANAYNGTGYASHGVYSPYVFAGTNHYNHGLYTSDGKYSSVTVDQRIGVAAIIKYLLELNA